MIHTRIRTSLPFLALWLTLATACFLTGEDALEIVPRQDIAPHQFVYNEQPRTVVLTPGNWASLPQLSGGTLVRMESVMGNIHIELLDEDAPVTTENFLFYTDEQRYNLSFIHRSVVIDPEDPDSFDFVIQGGGYKLVTTPEGATRLGTVETEDPIVNEFKPENSNVRGTLSMAKVPEFDAQGNPIEGGGPDSATSQFFINLNDENPKILDEQNGGFTVFARVVGRGMEVVDAIADLPRFQLGGALNEIPLQNFSEEQGLQVNNLVLFPRIARARLVTAGNRPGILDFEIVSVGDPDLLQAAVDEKNLLLGIPGGASGETSPHPSPL